MSKFKIILSLFVVTGVIISFSYDAAAGRYSRRHKQIKKEEQSGPASGTELKKIVALGQVNAGPTAYYGGGSTKQANESLKLTIKKELEKSGDFVVVTPKKSSRKHNMEELEKMAASQPKNIAAQMKLVQQMQESMAMGNKVYKDVAAQALFSFNVMNSGSSSSGAGLSGYSNIPGAENLPIPNADVSTSSVNVEMLCAEHNPRTGEMVDKYRARVKRGRITQGDLVFFDLSSTGDVQHEIRRAFSSAIKKCVRWAKERMKKKPWAGSIFKVAKGKVYLNAGANAGIQPGQQFKVIKKEALADASGASFGESEMTLGTIVINSVAKNYALASIVTGKAPVNSIVRKD